MTGNEYQVEALRTAGEHDQKAFLVNGQMGLCGEAGEVADLIKKHMFQNHELNIGKLMLELGDVCWYIAILAAAVGVDLDDVLQANIEKLKKRYPNGFEAAKSINRTD